MKITTQDSIKVRITSETQSQLVQKALFEKGFGWSYHHFTEPLNNLYPDSKYWHIFTY